MLVARLTDEGRLDATFFGGRVRDDALPGLATGLAFDADGRILVAGETTEGEPDVVVWRLLPEDPER